MPTTSASNANLGGSCDRQKRVKEKTQHRTVYTQFEPALMRITTPEAIKPFAGGGIVSLSVAFEQMAERVTMVELDDLRGIDFQLKWEEWYLDHL